MALLFTLLAAGSWLTSCYSATEIQLTVETDVPCETVRANGVALFIAGTSEALRANGPVATTRECTPGPGGASIGTLTLVPSGASTDRVFIDVVLGYDKRTDGCALDTPGCISARRAPRYIRHSSLRLPVRLYQRCASVHCKADETCEDGACVALDRCNDTGCGASGGVEAGADAEGPDAFVPDAAVDATCDGGACTPVVVTSGLPMPSELAVAGDDLYVTTDIADGGVVQCKTTGCSSPSVVISGLDQAGAVAADSTSLYYSAANIFLRVCDRPGCTNDRRLNPDYFSVLGMDTSKLYGIARFNAYATGILKTDGGTTLQTFANPVAMAFDAAEVFFYVEEGATNGLLRCPLAGCVPLSPLPTLLSVATDVSSMALDGSYVYWAETDTGRVMRAARDLASPAVPLSTTAKRPRSVAVDGAFVYWTEEGGGANDGQVVSTTKDGGGRLVLASAQAHPYRLLSAGGRMFWTNRVTDGAVMSVPLR